MTSKIEPDHFGARIRAVRKAQSLSLNDVEKMSKGIFKAVVLGSYERGVRAMSVDRCQALASVYQVPVSVFFGESMRNEASSAKVDSGTIFDLKKIRNRASNALRHDLERYQVLARYLQHLCQMRGDWNGEIISVRTADNFNLQLLLGLNSEELNAWIDFEAITLNFRNP